MLLTILGKQQKEALDLILKFIESKEISFTLSGYAGTGKTYLTKILIEKLKELNYHCEICAPTHKAKLVIEKFTGLKGNTLHKLLSLSPNLQLMELDFNDLQFLIPKNLNTFPSNSIIICDEASMINDDLYDLLVEKSHDFSCKIIFVCDDKQLKPVNSEELSKVFKNCNKYQLTEIFRQENGSALQDILEENRIRFINKFTNKLSDKGSVYVYSKPLDFLNKAIDNFKTAIENKDILETKILSYTNDRVKIFNDNCHNKLFSEEEYSVGEFLTCYDSFSNKYYDFYNGMDYIIKSIKQVKVDIPAIGVYPGYKLVVIDVSENVELSFKVLSKNISIKNFELIAESIERVRTDAINFKLSNFKYSKELWKLYYKIIESFTTPTDLYYNNRLIRKKTFDYGYAISVHKSQGSSINNVFVDMRSVNFCRDEIEKRQLQYVALSRTKNDIHILQ